jgi:nitrite reductase/ring-hydroxylating ferredoxin subunit
MSVEFHSVAKIADVVPDSMINVVVGDRDIALVNLGGTFYAIGGVCTHGAALLADGYVEGDVVECPQHAGTFDIKTGRAVAYPCTIDVPAYEVRVDGERVLVGIDTP